MSTVTIVLLVILVILIAAVICTLFLRKKSSEKQDEQQAQIQANKQTVSMLVIDKKRMPLKDSGLPQMVIDQTPKLMRPVQASDRKSQSRSEDQHPYCR